MQRTTRAVWKKRVERWQRSGQTAVRFAAALRVNPYTLKWWRWALAAERARRAAIPAVEAAQFVELVHGNPGAASDHGAAPVGVPAAALAPPVAPSHVRHALRDFLARLDEPRRR